MYLDSPFEICPKCNRPVLLDQTVATCRREQRCTADHCPLEAYFSGWDFEEPESAIEPEPHRR